MILVTTLVGAAACGPPPLPAPLVSPYYGWSALTDSDNDGFPQDWQVAQFNTCKANAGPVTITIVEREDAPAPHDVADIIASVNVGGSNVGSTPLTGPDQGWSSESLPAGTCFNVTITDANAAWFVDGALEVARFRYRIDW